MERPSLSFDETAEEPTFLFPDAVLAELLAPFFLDDAIEATRDFVLGFDAPPRTSKVLAVLVLPTASNDATSHDVLTTVKTELECAAPNNVPAITTIAVVFDVETFISTSGNDLRLFPSLMLLKRRRFLQEQVKVDRVGSTWM
jgi:hypothetical protein